MNDVISYTFATLAGIFFVAGVAVLSYEGESEHGRVF